MSNDVRDWYDSRHRTMGADAWRPREAYTPFLRALGPLRAGARVLDVGCGTGHLLALCTGHGLDGTGIDLSRYALRLCREHVPPARFAMASGTALPFADAAFEYVTCIGVLEHFPDVEAGAKELARVTAPGGRLCVVLPNASYYVWKLRGEGGTEQQEIGEVLLDLDEWRGVLTRAGLRVRGVAHDRWPARRVPLLASHNPLGVARRLARRALWALLPIRYTYQFIFSLDRP